MSAGATEMGGRWVVAAGIAVAVVVGFLLLVRLPPPPVVLPVAPLASAPRLDASVKIVDGSDQLIREEMELRDLRPLFLPTNRNAALPDPRLEAGQTFLDTENPRLSFAAENVEVVRLAGKPVADAEPLDVLRQSTADLGLIGFGRAETTIKPLPARGGYLEVTDMRDGRRILAEELPAATARPPEEKAWTPVDYVAVVDEGGLVSPLVVTESSRVDEVDVYFKNFLAQKFRIGDRLEPGLYRVSVAP